MPFFGDTREMACTRADIERWLGEMLGAQAFARVAEGFEVPLDGFLLRIRIEPVPPRRVGLVQLRLSRVAFEYPAQHQPAAHDWIRRFDRHTQRGGG